MSAQGKPSLGTRIAYGIGGATDGIKNNGFEYFLLFYYSLILGVPAGLVMVALTIALIVDAVSDPVVGYWSDNCRTKWGRRHPFMYAALIPVCVSYFLTWNPPAGLDTGGLFAWLVVMTLLVRISFTFFEVPASALAAELTNDYDGRTSLMAARYFFAWFGGLSIQVLLLFVLLKNDFTNLDGWHTYGMVAAGVILLTSFICAAGTHKHIPHLKPPPVQRKLTLSKVFSEIFETVSNPSFRALFLGTLCGLIATGISATLNQYINSIFWGFTPVQISGLTMGVFLSAGAALVLAPIIGKVFGKKRGAIVIGLVAFTLAPTPVVLRLLGLLPPNGTELLYWIILIITVFDLVLIITFQMLSGSMVADIVEDSELKTGRRSEGIFFAGISFVRKLSQASGVFVATIVLGIAQIQAGAGPAEVSETSTRLLGIGYAAGVFTAWMLMLVCFSFYRITRETHESNLSKLESLQSTDPGAHG